MTEVRRRASDQSTEEAAAAIATFMQVTGDNCVLAKSGFIFGRRNQLLSTGERQKRGVEQRVDAVLEIADRVAFIENGRDRDTLPAEALRADHSLVERYVGV